MDPDAPDRLRDRIRWENVVRAVGLLCAVALVVAWPRLGAPPPRLPQASAVPVAPEFGPEALAPEEPASRGRRAGRRRPRTERHHRRTDRLVRHQLQRPRPSPLPRQGAPRRPDAPGASPPPAPPGERLERRSLSRPPPQPRAIRPPPTALEEFAP